MTILTIHEKERISAIASEKQFDCRVAKYEECEHLSRPTCRACGCFVELRVM